MMHKFNGLLRQTKSTQILFGFVGTIYGTVKVIEYYPKKIIKIMSDEHDIMISNTKINNIKKINEYENEIKNYLNVIKNVDNELKNAEKYSFLYKLFSFGSVFANVCEMSYSELMIKEIQEKIKNINETTLKNKTIKCDNVQEPLFLVKNNDLITNIACSSIFYGTIFCVAGIFPIITFPALAIYGCYHHYTDKDTDKDIK
jgi:hypothetical protein